MGDACWQIPTRIPELEKHEVHVWRVPLDDPAVDVTSLHGALVEDERQRAARFYFARDRRRFVVARGMLRFFLGRYLDAKPASLRFRYSAHGKPSLAAGWGGDTLRFNISHANGLAVLAFALGREVGVDVEYIRPDLARLDVAEMFFSAQEVAVLRALPAEAQARAFFDCWTRKEAYIKARGEGLSLPLDQFDVSLSPGEPARLLSTPGDPSEAARWSLRALWPGPGYAAALAAEGPPWQLQCWQWTHRL
ncbi:MAG: 4'-phosphopantetheinyl transferase family protein [Chloroflexota bacterium]